MPLSATGAASLATTPNIAIGPYSDAPSPKPTQAIQSCDEFESTLKWSKCKKNVTPIMKINDMGILGFPGIGVGSMALNAVLFENDRSANHPANIPPKNPPDSTLLMKPLA